MTQNLDTSIRQCETHKGFTKYSCRNHNPYWQTPNCKNPFFVSETTGIQIYMARAQTIYSALMKGSLTATNSISSRSEITLATKRPMRPNPDTLIDPPPHPYDPSPPPYGCILRKKHSQGFGKVWSTNKPLASPSSQLDT